MLSAAVVMGAFVGASASAQSPFNLPALSDTTFEGPYVGAFAGYNQTETDLEGTSVSVSGLSASGATGGVYLGVISRVGMSESLLVGMEADFGYASGAAKLSTDTESREIDPGRTIGVSGMLGIAPADRLHVYGKLGYAHTRFDANDVREGVDGVRFGAGGEYAIDQFWTLRGELIRTEYRSINTEDSSFDPAQTSVTAGVRRKF